MYCLLINFFSCIQFISGDFAIYGKSIDCSDDFQCHICGKKLSRKYRLKKHLETHSGVRRIFKCDLCGLEFTWRESLNLHIKRKHVVTADISCL